MTDINTIIQFVPNTPEHVLVNIRNSYCDVLLSFTLTGSGGTKTLSLIYPHKKKSQGVTAGLVGGQCVSAMFRSVERCLERIGL
jgi:hypothetical protein